ncbi:hypothetical protein [Microlunatus flavus]|uniref:Uncharacterized protein n=1 Tax=Microlunatus flavus TaxID=1036181 RepID=A0A1H9HM76_9ACTN|nr:hypothetical protein [Microlunatus flavus]SEQ63449.1 hypothetical protein SAMN05421756_104317 [Microlunatus flavus]
MSTDLRDPASKPPGDGPSPEEKPKPALSITQVVGGALAAMTAAALGSRLSVAGTVVGAALASVVAAVASAFYTSSLRRTSKTVSTVWKTRVRPDGHGGTETVVEEVTEDGTVISPATADDRTGTADRTAPLPATPAAGTDPGRLRRTFGWKKVVLAAVLMFAVAAAALTGLELATGRSLSGGTGTTVGQVADGENKPAPKARSTPTRTRTPSATPSASASASAEPTAAPSASASSTPSAPSSTPPTPQPSPTSSVAPSATASAAPSATPGTSAGAGSGVSGAGGARAAGGSATP